MPVLEHLQNFQNLGRHFSKCMFGPTGNKIGDTMARIQNLIILPPKFVFLIPVPLLITQN